MLRNRKAFSMIELIFVIFITGILASLAIPRFTGVSDDAHLIKLQAFAGTLNRSVGPMLWSGVQRREPDKKGSVKESMNYHQLREYLDIETIPTEFQGLGDPKVISLTSCMEANCTIPSVGSPVGELANGKIAVTSKIGSKTYALGCIDSNIASSPKFYLYDENEGVIVY